MDKPYPRITMGNLQRVFITGASGFIGSRLTKALLSDGYDVGFMRRRTSNMVRISGLVDDSCVYYGDIRQSDDVFKAISDFSPDAVLHLVTYYAVEHTPQEVGTMVDTNVKGTINLLEASKECGVKLFVNTSTCAVYDQKDHPLKEEDEINPQNLYALTKLQAEESCRFFSNNYGINSVTLRLFPPFGPSDNERRMIPSVIRSFQEGNSPLLTTGRQKWDFVYVDDVVDAYRALLKFYPLKKQHDILNIGTGEPVSVRDVVLLIQTMMGNQIQPSFGAVPHRNNEVWFNSADITKARNLISWQPATGLQEGLQQTVRWFLNNRRQSG